MMIIDPKKQVKVKKITENIMKKNNIEKGVCRISSSLPIPLPLPAFPEPRTPAQRGVTLIEMAAVIGLILILVTIGMVMWSSQSERALRNTAVHTTRDIITVMKIYRTDNGDYPNYPAGTGVGLFLTYSNITSLAKDYSLLSILTSGSAVCLEGVLAGIQGDYRTILCAETDDAGAVKYRSQNQPACCWGKGQAAGYCDTAANWYACKNKM